MATGPELNFDWNAVKAPLQVSQIWDEQRQREYVIMPWLLQLCIHSVPNMNGKGFCLGTRDQILTRETPKKENKMRGTTKKQPSAQKQAGSSTHPLFGAVLARTSKEAPAIRLAPDQV